MASSWQLDCNRVNSDLELAKVLITAGLPRASSILLVLKMAVSVAEFIRQTAGVIDSVNTISFPAALKEFAPR